MTRKASCKEKEKFHAKYNEMLKNPEEIVYKAVNEQKFKFISCDNVVLYVLIQNLVTEFYFLK
jgi:hypothetical protein